MSLGNLVQFVETLSNFQQTGLTTRRSPPTTSRLGHWRGPEAPVFRVGRSMLSIPEIPAKISRKSQNAATRSTMSNLLVLGVALLQSAAEYSVILVGLLAGRLPGRWIPWLLAGKVDGGVMAEVVLLGCEGVRHGDATVLEICCLFFSSLA